MTSAKQIDDLGNEVAQTQSGEVGAADVNVASGSVGIDQSAPGTTNAVVTIPNWLPATAPSNATPSAYVNSLLVKAGAGKLFSLSGYNSKGSAQFIQVFDSATLPAEGAVPEIVLTAATVANFSASYGAYGRQFSSGIYIVNSSTGPTKTIGSADIWVDAQFL